MERRRLLTAAAASTPTTFTGGGIIVLPIVDGENNKAMNHVYSFNIPVASKWAENIATLYQSLVDVIPFTILGVNPDIVRAGKLYTYDILDEVTDPVIKSCLHYRPLVSEGYLILSFMGRDLNPLEYQLYSNSNGYQIKVTMAL